MASRPTLVRKCGKVSKASLHDLLMVGWQRMIATYGKGPFCDYLEISTTAMDKQLTGSMPGFDLIVDAVCAEPHVLDDVMAALGMRMVAQEGDCDADDMQVVLAKLMLWHAQATHPDSPGGRRVVHSEVGDAESWLRQIHKLSGDLIAGLAEARKPRAVS
jgi:hypothetical protein